MKTKNLLFAGAIALSTVMSPMAAMISATPVLAVTPNAGNPDSAEHTIMITGTEEGYVYDAYQIFAGSTTGTAGDKVLANVTWGSGVNTSGFTDGKFENKTAQEWANSLNTEADARAFATKISSHLSTTKESGTVAEGDTSVSISVEGDGYYLIKDGSTNNAKPTEFIMKVVNDVTVTPKTENEPEHEKKVQENVKTPEGTPDLVKDANAVGDKWNDVADYEIGDTIPFTLAAKVPDMEKYTQYEFEFIDTMDAGLTLDKDSIHVYVNGVQHDELIKGSIAKADRSFSLTTVLKGVNEGTQVTGINKDDVITVKFTAKLNSEAAMNAAGNENSFVLKYSNNPSTNSKGETQPDEVVVFTYELDLNKVDDTKGTPKALTGAEFKLYKEVGENKVKNYLQATRNEETGEYTVTGWTTDETNATPLTAKTVDSNEFVIKGLDDGDYFVKETKAPAGYTLPSTDFSIKLAAATKNNQTYGGEAAKAIGTISVNGTKGNNASIINTKGTNLPETGGMGTTMLYTIGGVLVAGSAVLFTVNKRMKKED